MVRVDGWLSCWGRLYPSYTASKTLFKYTDDGTSLKKTFLGTYNSTESDTHKKYRDLCQHLTLLVFLHKFYSHYEPTWQNSCNLCVWINAWAAMCTIVTRSNIFIEANLSMCYTYTTEYFLETMTFDSHNVNGINHDTQRKLICPAHNNQNLWGNTMLFCISNLVAFALIRPIISWT